MFSTPQVDELGKYSDLLYIQERDPRAEQWNGYRLGIDGAKAMGFERVKLRQQFVTNPPNFSTYDQVLMIDFQDDERDLAGDAYDLF